MFDILFIVESMIFLNTSTLETYTNNRIVRTR